MFWTTAAYAMGGAGAAGAGGEASVWANLLPIVAMFGVFYFLLIRPQQKRAKEHKALISALKKGDEVITAGGLYGRVTDTGDEYVMLDLGNSVVKVSRSAVSVVRTGTKVAVDKKGKKEESKPAEPKEADKE